MYCTLNTIDEMIPCYIQNATSGDILVTRGRGNVLTILNTHTYTQYSA